MDYHLTYLSLGSNLGEREKQIGLALSLISEGIGMITLRSSLYETEPWGFQSEAKFLNMVVCVETLLEPDAVMQKILEIEEQCGRNRTGGGYVSRTIDIDILFYDDLIIRSENLIIPHPRLAERKFVLEPMNDLAPEMIHPVTGVSVRELLTNCMDENKVTKINSPSGNNG
ncbi:MAG: 2-amino-4-hydroxy-6-hydroxymethyldihydropteridine diphosphokinase [Bacteroidetes bacterium]|nr:2-amino-4-hydroxy-6-hydroxymethyldihydropteridine diphosphokinase [Bacteroidota bacterium]